MKEVQGLLGKLLSDPELQEWVAALGATDEVVDSGQPHVHHCFRKRGVEVMVDRNTGKAFCFTFYGQPEASGESDAFREELPPGIRTDQDVSTVMAILDTTGPRLFDDPREKGWESSIGCRVSITLRRDLNRIRSIAYYL